MVWQKSGSEIPMSYDKAQAYIRKLNQENFAVHDAWRLPTPEELASLIENEKMNKNLHISPVFDATQQWCWSSDFYDNKLIVWYVNFSGGGSATQVMLNLIHQNTTCCFQWI